VIRNPELYKPAHKNNAFHSVPYEWWYFDCVFDNGYALWSIWFCGNPGNRNPEERSLEFCIADPDGMVTQLTPVFSFTKHWLQPKLAMPGGVVTTYVVDTRGGRFIKNSGGYPPACWREESGSPQGEAMMLA